MCTSSYSSPNSNSLSSYSSLHRRWIRAQTTALDAHRQKDSFSSAEVKISFSSCSFEALNVNGYIVIMVIPHFNIGHILSSIVCWRNSGLCMKSCRSGLVCIAEQLDLYRILLCKPHLLKVSLAIDPLLF